MRTARHSSTLSGRTATQSGTNCLPPASRASSIESLDELSNDELWQRLIAARIEDANAPRTQALRNAILERYMPLVRHIAEKLVRNLPRHVELEPLVSAGVFGLIDAIRGFDLDRSVQFKTYAAMRVRGSIIDMLRDIDWAPRLVRTRAAAIERATAKLSALYDRQPTHAELSAEIGVDAATLQEHLRDAYHCRLVAIVDGSDDETSEHCTSGSLADPRAFRPEDILHERSALLALMGSFSAREKFILTQYYEMDHTMAEIGEMLGITESRICQIHANLLSRLRCIAERQQREGNL